MLCIILLPILQFFLQFASTTGATIPKSRDAARNSDQYGCLTLSEGARLDFENKEDAYMKNELAAQGERVELRCKVIGAPQATIRWKHNGVFLDKAQTGDYQALLANGEMPVIGIGATVSTLVIDCVDRTAAGLYTCVAENRCSEAIETSAVVAIEEAEEYADSSNCIAQSISAEVAPKITFMTDSALERPEATVILFCRAAGQPQPEIQWFEEEKGSGAYRMVKDDDRHLLLSNGDLLIRGQSSSSDKPYISYKCVASNEYGGDSMETVVIYATL